MKHYRNMTALAFGVLAGTAIFAGGKTVAADTLDTEIAGAGIAVALNDTQQVLQQKQKHRLQIFQH